MSYPVTIDVETPERIANWRPLVQWLLGIPHLLIAGVLENVAQLLAFISWFVILFTGRLPEGIANFQAMTLRYGQRSRLYAGFLYETYPPFDFTVTSSEPGGSPMSLTVTPELEERNRVSVAFRLILAIPAMLFTVLIAIVGVVCHFLAFFAVLFTGRWPQGLRTWVMNMVRVWTRLQAYLLLLTDEYPPLNTEV